MRIKVIWDKPLAWFLIKLNKLVDMAQKLEVIFALIFDRAGFPMVKQVCEVDTIGDLGQILVNFQL